MGEHALFVEQGRVKVEVHTVTLSGGLSALGVDDVLADVERLLIRTHPTDVFHMLLG